MLPDKKSERPGGPTHNVQLTGGGPRDSFGSDILAKRDFYESMKDTGIFLGH